MKKPVRIIALVMALLFLLVIGFAVIGLFAR